MKLLSRLLVGVAGLHLVGCGSPVPPAESKPSPAAATAINVAEEPDECNDRACCQFPSRAELAQSDLAGSLEPTPPGAPRALPILPEEGTFQVLTPDGHIQLQTREDHSRRLWITATVCQREAPLELFLCRTQTKEHEAIVSTDAAPVFMDATLKAMGAEPGSPAEFEPEYKPATGSVIQVSVYYRGDDGKPVLAPAQSWIRESETKQPMQHHWVFAGSRLYPDPVDPNGKPMYAANNGNLISLANFYDSMLDLPIKSLDNNDFLLYEANPATIPPLGSKVYVILEVQKPAAKSKPAQPDQE